MGTKRDRDLAAASADLQLRHATAGVPDRARAALRDVRDETIPCAELHWRIHPILRWGAVQLSRFLPADLSRRRQAASSGRRAGRLHTWLDDAPGRQGDECRSILRNPGAGVLDGLPRGATEVRRCAHPLLAPVRDLWG